MEMRGSIRRMYIRIGGLVDGGGGGTDFQKVMKFNRRAKLPEPWFPLQPSWVVRGNHSKPRNDNPI
jgi:hypothetical protein